MLGGVDHLPAFRDGKAHRLLDQDVQAGLRRRDGDRHVPDVWTSCLASPVAKSAFIRRLSFASYVPFAGVSPEASTPHATCASHAALRSFCEGGLEERRISCFAFASSMVGIDRTMQSR